MHFTKLKYTGYVDGEEQAKFVVPAIGKSKKRKAKAGETFWIEDNKAQELINSYRDSFEITEDTIEIARESNQKALVANRIALAALVIAILALISQFI